MNIIKLAARMIKIRTTINRKTGKTDVRVVDNPNAEGCDHEFNEKLLMDLIETEVPGFGKFQLEDKGLTEVGYQNKMKDTTKPLPVDVLKNPNKPATPQGDFTPQQPIQQPQLDTGFGV